MLNRHMWMVATISDSTITEFFHYCRKFFWTVLLCPSNLGSKHACLSQRNKSPTVCLLTRQFKGNLLYSNIHSFNKYLLTTCYISWLCFPMGHVRTCGFRFQRPWDRKWNNLWWCLRWDCQSSLEIRNGLRGCNPGHQKCLLQILCNCE